MMQNHGELLPESKFWIQNMYILPESPNRSCPKFLSWRISKSLLNGSCLVVFCFFLFVETESCRLFKPKFGFLTHLMSCGALFVHSTTDLCIVGRLKPASSS